MPGFKDLVAQDLGVFLSTDEFGENHMIDGREVAAVVDDQELAKRKANASNPTDGVYAAELLFFAAVSSFEQRPVIGQPMKFDGRLYRIAVAGEDDGMYTIALERNRS